MVALMIPVNILKKAGMAFIFVKYIQTGWVREKPYPEKSLTASIYARSLTIHGKMIGYAAIKIKWQSKFVEIYRNFL